MQVVCFGLGLVKLDIRQESSEHSNAISFITEYLGLGTYRWPPTSPLPPCFRGPSLRVHQVHTGLLPDLPSIASRPYIYQDRPSCWCCSEDQLVSVDMGLAFLSCVRPIPGP